MKDIKLLESVQCRTMMMMKSLKGKMNEEQLYKRFLLIELELSELTHPCHPCTIAGLVQAQMNEELISLHITTVVHS